MKLIIDVPDENYKLICSDGRPFLPSYKWIYNGTLLDEIRAEIYALNDDTFGKSSSVRRVYSLAISDALRIIEKHME